MKKFFEDLYEMVWKNEVKFLKLHWRGYIALVIAGLTVQYIPDIIDWCKAKAKEISGKEEK